MNTHKVFWGDARNMGDLPDNSVHLGITSPPYWQLKDYGAEGQIGFDQSLDEYLTSLHAVWNECFRVLHSGCRLCVNIGDQFARAAHYGRYKVIPLHEAVIHSCEQIGFDYMGAIIWQKNTTMNTSGGGSVMGSFPYPRNGVVKIDYEFILLFKKLGKPPKVMPEQKLNAAMTTKEWNEYFNGHWNFAGERQGDGHIAMFPLELPRRLIRMFSFPGETILDPFLGSGTTMSAAMELGRNAIGYEINHEFESSIRQRLNLHNEQLNFHDVQFVESSAPTKINIASTNGTSSLTRQVNPKEFRFNSVIGLEDAAKPRERGLRVHEIIAPDQLRLADGGLVHLLGIRPRAGREEAAVDYLKTKVLNRPVFLKHTETHEGNLRAYVYMENKTFINAKLLKEGLVEVDPSVEHHYSARFREYQGKAML